MEISTEQQVIQERFQQGLTKGVHETRNERKQQSIEYLLINIKTIYELFTQKQGVTNKKRHMNKLEIRTIIDELNYCLFYRQQFDEAVAGLTKESELARVDYIQIKLEAIPFFIRQLEQKKRYLKNVHLSSEEYREVLGYRALSQLFVTYFE